MQTFRSAYNELKQSWTRRWLQRTVLLAVLFILFFILDGRFRNFRKLHATPRKLVFKLPLPSGLAEKFKLPLRPDVEKVIVAGFFSDWSPDDDFYRMHRDAPGVWSRKVRLEPGDNQYKFVVYVKGLRDPVWIHDEHNPRRVSDSHKGFNSVYRIPRLADIYHYLNIAVLAMLIIFGAYYLLEPLILLLLHLKISFRIKIVVSLLFIVVISNIAFILYQRQSSRGLVRQGIIDGINLVHLFLEGEGVDFSKAHAQQNKIKAALLSFFYRAKTRVEKNKHGNRQTTISDLVLLDRRLKPLAVVSRRQNRKLHRERARRYGFPGPEEYLVNGMLGDLISQARKRLGFETLFSAAPAKLLKLETERTRQSASALGFQVFLHPVVIRQQIMAFYGGVIQTKLYGREMTRIVQFNVVMLAVVFLFSLLLLASLGRVVTQYLSELAEWTDRINEGDFSVEKKIASGDEIQLLAENFNRMRLSLKESFRKIEERNRLLQVEAYVDNLTCLPNRRRLVLDFKDRRCGGILLFNVDSFRGINDFFGSEVGDFILKELATRLAESVEDREMGLYKLGADEFVITIEKKIESAGKGLEQLAGEFCDLAMELPYRYLGNQIYISVTAGSALSTGKESSQDLLTNAGYALKAAKKVQIRHMVYSGEIDSARNYEYNVRWTAKLKKAITENRIVPFFQPIVNNDNGKIEKYECLVRLIDEDGSIISPVDFLPVSREARFYRFITRIMLTRSIERFKEEPFEFSVNLSMEDVLDRKTHEIIMDALSESPETAKRLVFEIVESAEIESYSIMYDFIEKVKRYGVKIAIDDFGIGFSNFEHIMKLPIDYLKIDASLIRNIPEDRSSALITSTIAGFARRLGIMTVAEYVHSEEVYRICRDFGIDYSQGYYFGEPRADL